MAGDVSPGICTIGPVMSFLAQPIKNVVSSVAVECPIALVISAHASTATDDNIRMPSQVDTGIVVGLTPDS